MVSCVNGMKCHVHVPQFVLSQIDFFIVQKGIFIKETLNPYVHLSLSLSLFLIFFTISIVKLPENLIEQLLLLV